MVDIANTAAELERARSVHRQGSRTPHTVVLLPSYSVTDSLLARYADRLLDMEHRHLLNLLVLPRVPGARVIFVTSQRPAPAVLDYYLSLVPPDQRTSMRARIRILDVGDPSPRSVTAKLLDRPDLLAQIQRQTSGLPAYIEPWNATSLETELARRLGLPLNGTAPELWPLGFKSSGRRLLRLAGVPVPFGHEDIRTVDEVLAAIEDIQRRRPQAAGVVVKADDSAAGNGNRVIHFSGGTQELHTAVRAMEPELQSVLEHGGVVEELVRGSGFATPSVQVDVGPGGEVEILSTHEQVMGGPESQVYQGCELPARPRYGARLATYGAAVGQVLAERGVLGPFSVDFAAVRCPTGWSTQGLEINLRKSGTTHPLSLLHNLVSGHYDPMAAEWVTEDGSGRSYRSTDSLVTPGLSGRSVEEVVEALRESLLAYDQRTRVGVVLHNLCSVPTRGRLGLTAIGRSPGHARALYAGAAGVLAASASTGFAPASDAPPEPPPDYSKRRTSC